METRSIDEDFRRFRVEGDPEALARVFDAAAPRLLLLAQHLTRDAARAEDLVQTVFLQAIEGAEAFVDGRRVMPWLNAILAHRAADVARRESRRATTNDGGEDRADGEGLDPASVAAAQELAERAGDAIDALRDPYRQVLVLRLIHGLEPIEIAHALGRPPGTVRMQLARGLERLRQRLPEESAFGLVLLLEPARGLGAVREAVVARATEVGPLLLASSTGTAAVTAGSTTWSLGGLLAMKVQVLVGATLALLVSVWALGPDAPESSGIATAASSPDATEVAIADREMTPAPVREADGLQEPQRVAVRAEARETPAEEKAQLSVRVSLGPGSREGEAVEGIGIYVRQVGSSALGIEATTDESGVARYHGLADGTWRVHVDRARSVAAEVTLRAGKSRSLELTLASGVDVEGTVVDLAGNPIPGATILALNPAHHDYLQTVTRSDAQGQFRIPHAAERARFGARAPGWQPSDPSDGRVRDDGTGRATLRLELGARGHALTGTVLGPDGSPEAHALVAVTVDEDARDSIEGLPIEDPEAAPPKAPDTEAFYLRADAAGRFSSDEVPGGRAVVLARPRDTSSPHVGWAVVFVAPGITSEVAVHLAPGAEVHGTVRNENGDPLANVEVEAEWEGTPELGQTEDDLGPLFADRRTRTADDGSYRLVGLLPGETDLRILFESGDRAADHDTSISPGEVLPWNPTLAVRDDLALELGGPDGSPLTGWRVGSTTSYGRVRWRDIGPATDSRGCTTLRDLEVRAYQITLHAPTNRSDVESANELMYTSLPTYVVDDVVPGPEVVKIRLPADALPSASLVGRWIDSSGEPVAEGRLRLGRAGWDDSCAARTETDGSFSFTALAPGNYTVTVDSDLYPAGTPLCQVELARDDERDVGDVTLPRPSRLIAIVRDAAGQPVERPLVAVQRHRADPRSDDTVWMRPDRDGDPRPLALCDGTYELRTLVDGFAPTVTTVELSGGGDRIVEITVERGVPRSFRVAFPAAAAARGGEGRVDVFIWNEDDALLLDDRVDGELDADGFFPLTLSLLPGSYRARFVDHRRGVEEHAESEIRFDVSAGLADPVEVQIEEN